MLLYVDRGREPGSGHTSKPARTYGSSRRPEQTSSTGLEIANKITPESRVFGSWHSLRDLDGLRGPRRRRWGARSDPSGLRIGGNELNGIWVGATGATSRNRSYQTASTESRQGRSNTVLENVYQKLSRGTCAPRRGRRQSGLAANTSRERVIPTRTPASGIQRSNGNTVVRNASGPTATGSTRTTRRGPLTRIHPLSLKDGFLRGRREETRLRHNIGIDTV